MENPADRRACRTVYRTAWRNLALLWLALPALILLYKVALDLALGRPALEGLARLHAARFLGAVALVNLLLTAVYAWFLWRDLIDLDGWRAALAAEEEGPPPRAEALPAALMPFAAALLAAPAFALARRLSPGRGHLYALPALAILLAVLAQAAGRLLRRLARRLDAAR